jgi:hypothetical protein
MYLIVGCADIWRFGFANAFLSPAVGEYADNQGSQPTAGRLRRQ